MNWGHGIAITFGLFTLFMGFLVYRSFQQNIDLVAEDYYKQELQYQDRIDQLQQTRNDEQSISIEQQKQSLAVNFNNTKGSVNGTIRFFRPSDAKFDQHITINLDSQARQMIDLSKLVKGYYRVQVDWKENGQSYFVEQSINIR